MFLKEKKNIFIIFLYVSLLNLIAHFIPFERSSVAPDDYFFLLSKFLGFNHFIQNPDRPLQYIWLGIQNTIIGENAQKGLIGVFISSLLTIFSAYYLIRLFFNKDTSLLIIIIYSLFISKLEIFHTPIFIYINLVSSIYIISLINFIIYIKNKNFKNYIISLFLYSLGIFWYEVGIFIVFIFLLYYFLNNNFQNNFKKSIILLIPFFTILLFYSIYRSTGAFGAVENFPGHQIELFNLFQGIKDSFHHLFGRYLVRNIIYGVYLFFQIETNLLILIIFVDVLFLIVMIIITRKLKLQNLDRKNTILFFFIFLIALLPNLLAGSVGGRSLIISSISFSIFLYLILYQLKKNWRKVFIFFSIFGIIICQGNAWAQVISCRINNSIYETIKENENKILESDFVIIDMRSFSDNINHNFFSQEFNILNTYFGAQALETWGLKSMVKLIANKSSKKIGIYVASESPIITENNETKFSYIMGEGYRDIYPEKIVLKNSDIFIINYNLVYEDGFFNGKKQLQF